MGLGNRLAVGVLLIILVGCVGKSFVLNDVTNPPVDAESTPLPERAKVCVVRSSPTEGSTAHAVRDNGALVGATRGTSHFCYLAEPGEHTIRIDGGAGDSTTSFTAKGGRIVFLGEEVTEVMGSVVTKLSWLEEAEAKPLITATKAVVIVSAPNDEQTKPLAPRR